MQSIFKSHIYSNLRSQSGSQLLFTVIHPPSAGCDLKMHREDFGIDTSLTHNGRVSGAPLAHWGCGAVIQQLTAAPLSAAAAAGDLWLRETNEVVAPPPCFFCKINSASGCVRPPCFMNDGNLLRPSIYLHLQHRYAPPCSPSRLPCCRRQGFSNPSCLEKNTFPSGCVALCPAHMCVCMCMQIFTCTHISPVRAAIFNVNALIDLMWGFLWSVYITGKYWRGTLKVLMR